MDWREFPRNLIRDIISKLFVAAISSIITGIILFDKVLVNELAYLLLLAILTIGLLVGIIINSYLKKPIAAKFKNEEAALPTIKEMISHTQQELCILSKVGTTVFFAFKEYCDLLAKGKKIKVLIVNPNDAELIKMMDNLYLGTGEENKQTETENKWSALLLKVKVRVNDLYSEKQIDQSQYKNLSNLLNEAKGYRNLILASSEMWNLTRIKANELLQSNGTYILAEDALDLRAYGKSDLPDLKAWIFDDTACLIGHHNEVSLGRENPITCYKSHRAGDSKRHKDNENCQSREIRSIIRIWDFRWALANKINIANSAKNSNVNKD